MGKRRYSEIAFDEDGNPLIVFLPGERYSVTDLNDILCLMSLKSYEELRRRKDKENPSDDESI